MDPIVGGAIIGAGANLGSQVGNWLYGRDLQRRAWRREDTAVQRRVSDLKAAGLSPTLAAGSAASSSSPIALKAPEIDMSPLVQSFQIASTKADTALKLAQLDKVVKETEGTGIDNDFKKLQVSNLTNEIARFLRDEAIYKGEASGQLSGLKGGFVEFMNALNTTLGSAGLPSVSEILKSLFEKGGKKSIKIFDDYEKTRERNEFVNESGFGDRRGFWKRVLGRSSESKVWTDYIQQIEEMEAEAYENRKKVRSKGASRSF